jgi:hypothetical protein
METFLTWPILLFTVNSSNLGLHPWALPTISGKAQANNPLIIVNKEK